MTSKNIIKGFTYQMLVLCTISLFSQKAYCQLNNDKNEVTVIASYEPTISDAFKINFNPNIRDSAYEKPNFTYTIQSKKIPTSFMLEPIKPAKIVGEPISKLYKNLIKAGFGNYLTPYIEIYANSVRSKTYSFGVHAKHLSSSGSIKDYAESKYSNNALEVYGMKYFKKSTLDGEVYFHRDVINYYGFKPIDFPTYNADIKQRYAIIGLNATYYSNYVDSNLLNHKIGFGFYNLSDRYSTHENNLKFNFDLDKNVQFFDFSDKQTIGIKTSIDYYNNGGAIGSSVNSAIFGFKPYISTHFNEYLFYAGVDMSIATSTGVATKLHIYPKLEAALNIIPKVLKVYGGISGGIDKSSFRTLSDENPFINTNTSVGFSNKKFEIYAGINSSLTKTIDFSASISNSTIDGMPLFVNDTNTVFNAPDNQFTAVYDKVNRLKINAIFLFKYDEKLNFVFNANLYRYSTDLEAEAWHKPGFDASLSARYNINNKIIAHADIYTFTKSYAKVYSNNLMIIKEIDGMLDANIGVEYRYSKILSGFLNINNLTAGRYEKWYDYPNQRFNMMLGFTYAF